MLSNHPLHFSELSPRKTIKNIVLQGDTWGSILASVHVETIGKESQAAGYGIKYKDSLPISLLGLVDDTIRVTEAGFRAQQMNVLMNVRTAEKTLQFGASKCKSMLIGKERGIVFDTDLLVDNWIVTYKDNQSGEVEIEETYGGQIPIDRTNEQKYLGFVISSKGDNMANITQLKKKSVGIIRTIINRLESFHLQKYYFECALIFMNAMLRGSILYGCETYYNLKEKELRQIEHIEEGYMRQILAKVVLFPIYILRWGRSLQDLKSKR